MSLTADIKALFVRQRDMLGEAATGRAVTATLRVSPNGNGADGLSWARAFTTIGDALDAASTNANEHTLIEVGITGTFYDINRPGFPSWACNVDIHAAHRVWAPIRNNNATATGVMRFTGLASLENLAIFTAGTVGGVIFTQNGYRVRHCGFNSEGLTGPATSILIDGVTPGATVLGGIMDVVEFRGNVAFTTAYQINQGSVSHNEKIYLHNCLVGIHILGAASDSNYFYNCGIGGSATAILIAAGDHQHFDEISLHGNVVNINDAVGNSVWSNIQGQFSIDIEPNNLVGVAVATAVGAGVYGGDTELRAALASTVPFRMVGVHTNPSAAGWFKLRLSADSGVTWFDVLLFDATKREGVAAPSGTEHIFNVGTRISGSVMSDTGNDTCAVWLEIQEI